MADPLEEVRLRSLASASQALEIELFDLVRLCVAAEVELPSGLALDPSTLDRLKTLGHVAAPWEHAAEATPDERLREILRGLETRGYIGDHATRLDNVWRALARTEQHLLAEALEAIEELGWVTITGRPEGRFVALAADPSEPLRAFLDGAAPPTAVAEVLAALGKSDVA